MIGSVVPPVHRQQVPARTQREDAEAELIGAYLPAELSDEELQGIVEKALADSGAHSPKDMGVAMKSVMAAVDGRADGKRVSGLVRAALGG